MVCVCVGWGGGDSETKQSLCSFCDVGPLSGGWGTWFVPLLSVGHFFCRPESPFGNSSRLIVVIYIYILPEIPAEEHRASVAIEESSY